MTNDKDRCAKLLPLCPADDGVCGVTASLAGSARDIGQIRMYPLEMEMTCQLSKKFNWPAVNDLWTYLRDLCAAEPMSRGHFRGMVKMLITYAEQASCPDRIYEHAP